MKKPAEFRMIRETYYVYQSQVARLEQLGLHSGLNKSELTRLAIEAYLRFFGFVDPEFEILPGEIEGRWVANYKSEFMAPFVEMMQEGRANKE